MLVSTKIVSQHERVSVVWERDLWRSALFLVEVLIFPVFWGTIFSVFSALQIDR